MEDSNFTQSSGSGVSYAVLTCFRGCWVEQLGGFEAYWLQAVVLGFAYVYIPILV